MPVHMTIIPECNTAVMSMHLQESPAPDRAKMQVSFIPLQMHASMWMQVTQALSWQCRAVFRV